MKCPAENCGLDCISPEALTKHVEDCHGPAPDIRVTGVSNPRETLVQFEPLSEAAREWIEANVETEPYQWLGNRLCVERRYCPDIINAMLEAGLEVV